MAGIVVGEVAFIIGGARGQAWRYGSPVAGEGAGVVGLEIWEGIDHFEANQTDTDIRPLAEPLMARDAEIVMGLP